MNALLSSAMIYLSAAWSVIQFLAKPRKANRCAGF